MSGGMKITPRRAAAAILLSAAIIPAAASFAAGDATKGKAAYMQCMACHSLDKSGKSGIGPNLYGVIDRPIGSVAGYKYSAAMAKKGGKWTAAAIDAYIASPAKAVPGNRMPYGGMKNAADRQNLIAYLASVK